MGILEVISQPWPWYVSGPLIGLMIPLLLFIGNKQFGNSSSFRHICAIFPNKHPFFRYDWRKEGFWNLMYVAGVVLGALVATLFFANPEALKVAASTTQDLNKLGIEVSGGLAPQSLFGLGAMFSLKGFLLLLSGGVLVGFGARYAGGCTSGHAITGLANLQLPSLVAVIGFFIGGLIMTHLIFPLIF
ncbi:MAG: YeeE/YedE thiosulfate transporter family protein [Deinococcales bacterium]